jgi:hypothetical protein
MQDPDDLSVPDISRCAQMNRITSVVAVVVLFLAAGAGYAIENRWQILKEWPKAYGLEDRWSGKAIAAQPQQVPPTPSKWRRMSPEQMEKVKVLSTKPIDGKYERGFMAQVYNGNEAPIQVHVFSIRKGESMWLVNPNPAIISPLSETSLFLSLGDPNLFDSASIQLYSVSIEDKHSRN